jgi:hypothetical protein
MDANPVEPTDAPPRRSPAEGSPGRSGVGTAWKVAASVFAVLLLGWGTLQVVSQLAHEERTTSTTFDAAGLTVLDVQVDSGSINVVGTDAEDVTVTARISDGLLSTAERQTIVGDRLELRGRCPGPVSNFCDVAYTIEVPARMGVYARSENDSIRLTGVEGDIDARSNNGPVVVRGSGEGRLRLATDNGTVDGTDLRAAEVDADTDNGSVTLVFARPPTAVEATSDNGDVTVAVPDDGTAYAVDVATSRGSDAAPIRTDPSSRRTIRVRSDNGSVLITYRPG